MSRQQEYVMSETMKQMAVIDPSGEPLQRANGRLGDTKVMDPLPADNARPDLAAQIAKFLAEFTGDES